MSVIRYCEEDDFLLLNADVLDGLRDLEEESIDCVVTSPPYWNLRDYEADGQIGLEETPEEFVARLVDVFSEVRRVLAPHGTVWLNIGDTYAASAGGRANGRYGDTAKTGARPRTPAGELKPKDMVGIPWRLAFALQADGWWLRSDVIWDKPNPMPSSTTDRPSTSHEYVFLLTKSARYYYDHQAVKEEAVTGTDLGVLRGRSGPHAEQRGRRSREGSKQGNPSGKRNLRTVWRVTTVSNPVAHFATFPPKLVERCLLAGCPSKVCTACGKARERVIEYGDKVPVRGKPIDADGKTIADMKAGSARLVYNADESMVRTDEGWSLLTREVLGSTWSDCGCGAEFRPGVVLDPFMGSGTTARVARAMGRSAVGIELNPEYCEIAARPTIRRGARIQHDEAQVSLFEGADVA